MIFYANNVRVRIYLYFALDDLHFFVVALATLR